MHDAALQAAAKYCLHPFQLSLDVTASTLLPPKVVAQKSCIALLYRIGENVWAKHGRWKVSEAGRSKRKQSMKRLSGGRRHHD